MSYGHFYVQYAECMLGFRFESKIKIKLANFTTLKYLVDSIELPVKKRIIGPKVVTLGII